MMKIRKSASRNSFIQQIQSSDGLTRNMALQKFLPSSDAPSPMKHLSLPAETRQLANSEPNHNVEPDVEIDIREVYFLIMHFLSSGPCQRTYGQLWNELLEHQLLPRRYHAWYSRNGVHCGDENDDGLSFPLSYNKLVERYPHIKKDHLVKLLKQLLLCKTSSSNSTNSGRAPNAADVPTLLGTGSFSLLSYDRYEGINEPNHPLVYMRWPHMKADQVRGLSLRELGGGFSRHQRAPSIRAACYAIAKPSTMVQKMQNIKRLRGHRNAVYCAIFDRLGRYVVTGSDDRLVKIWSMETADCLASCRGHEGDITDLAVSSNNAVVASSSNDFIIRVWRLPDGLPISVLRGHTGAVTAIAFSPRPGYQLLSSSDDGTCRIWDARNSLQHNPRIYVPRPLDSVTGRSSGPSSSTVSHNHQIFCCAFNANGTIFVTGSSDTLARVWNACKPNIDNPDQPNHEIDVLAGHENDVNYVQFSGCAVASRVISPDPSKEDSGHRFKNSWFTHDNIVTCSRDGSAIIWVPRLRRSHGKAGRWTRAYHLKVPPPSMPPQPTRGGPRQRILPTPRGVNMIIWSLDNRFVLAAIMDCRICVWNASDGSLVHSLTGHTESTYVLDVHPFNPRIAMSAGYDGKTIVWDIWEGTPIQIYDISRFKLVDGKFSSDGTSVILSDDVGQLYILSTGQGESKQDAKYDQFFLGDYRPLVQDTFGNVVDQETQLAPYRRNMQDLLCDSGMIPYPEPYQSIYQKRRLGSLGIEWRPSPLKFAVGPDFSLDPAYQMLPLADLDLLIEPLPEFVDAMHWEPENEVQSDTTDSEYNVPEDYSTGGEQGSLNLNSSIDQECSGEDTGGEDAQRDRLRRSKRKKHKAEMEFMSFSGRRIKRRNLDESDEHPIKSNRNRKLKVHLKISKKKSASKSSRPQRAAARNARHFFSKLKGASIDVEDEDGSVSDSSESESVLQDSVIESGESDTSLQNITKHSKGKEVYLDDSEDAIQPFEPPKSHVNSVNRGRLILKFPIRNFNRSVPPEDIMHKCSNTTNGVGSSSKAPGEAEEADQSRTNLEEPNYSLEEADISVGVEDLQDKIEGHINHSVPNKNGSIKWGGFKIRSSKRLKLGETATSDVQAISSSRLDDRNDMERSNLREYVGQENDSDNVMQDGENLNVKDIGLGAFGEVSNPAINPETTTFVKPGDHDEDRELDYLAIHNSTTSSTWNRTNSSSELSESKMPVSTKIRLKANIDRGASPKHEKKSLVTSMSNGKHAVLPGSPQYPVVAPDDNIDGCNLDNRSDGSREYDMLADKSLHSNPNKMYSAVYRRLKSHKSRTSLEVDESGSGEFSSYLCNNNSYNGIEGNEGTVDLACRTRSMRSKALINDSNNLSGNLKYEEDVELEPTTRNLENTSTSRCQFKYEEWGSKSSVTVGLRSARNRRANYVRDSSPTDRRKSHLLTRKGSWLMMSVHEGGSRYIPQLGDEVVYLRQGHQEYIEYCRAREVGPWISMKGRTIRAVEYCKVVELEYSTVSGSGASCCKMTLEFVDPDSSVFRGSFKLSLPEETSFPDFLVERSRFEASLQRNWRFRDKCKVWWRNEGEEDGSWWDGRITAVEAKSSEFPESPWERYRIRYKSEPADTHLHSPWELFDDDTHWEQPLVDHESKAKLLSALDKLELGSIGQDRYGVHELRRVSQRPQFRNRFPVPLTLEVIHLRLESDYYRSVEALKHDFEVMLSNFEAYAAKNENLLKRLKRLSEWFNKTLSSS